MQCIQYIKNLFFARESSRRPSVFIFINIARELFTNTWKRKKKALTNVVLDIFFL